jgi:hypothetical protein
MTLGGSPCPSLWGIKSETMVNICNSLIHNEFGDPRSLFDPMSLTLPSPSSLPDDVPFHQARELAVQIPIDNEGKADIYLNNILGVAPDIKNNIMRVSYAIPLAIHTLARPVNTNDTIPHKDIISIKKLLAEGPIEETKTILGWFVNTRLLSIHLPTDKHSTWSKSITNLISLKRVKHKQLEVLVPRCHNHTYASTLP